MAFSDREKQQMCDLKGSEPQSLVDSSSWDSVSCRSWPMNPLAISPAP